MKRIVSIVLCAVMLVSVLALSGCSGTKGTDLSTKLVEVVAVENDGFVAKMDNKPCYVKYDNADMFVSIGDILEITYYEYNHLAVDDTRTINGYSWGSVITDTEQLIVK